MRKRMWVESTEWLSVLMIVAVCLELLLLLLLQLKACLSCLATSSTTCKQRGASHRQTFHTFMQAAFHGMGHDKLSSGTLLNGYLDG